MVKKGRFVFICKKNKQFVWCEQEDGFLIDFNITNEDIAGFFGISTRNSVNRILNELKREGVLDIRQQKIVILIMNGLKNLSEGNYSKMATEAQIRKKKEKNYKIFYEKSER